MNSRTLIVMWTLAAALLACSGGRKERLNTACRVDSECPSGSRCEDGQCTEPSVEGAEGELQVSATPEGAPVTVEATSEGGECIDSACTVRRGATVRFRAPEAEGFRFAGWSGDPGCEGDEPLLVLREVDTSVACVAHYVRRLLVRGEVDGDGGDVEAQSDAAWARCDGPECEVDAAQSVLLRASPREGFRFSRWSGEGCEDGSGPELAIVAESDVLCTAHYVPGFRVRGVAEGAEAAIEASSASASAQCEAGGCELDAGADVRLWAPALDGYRFAGWTGDAACVTAEPSVEIAAADADLLCTAHYVPRFHVRGQAQGASPLPTLQASSADTFAQCSGDACEVDLAGTVTLLAPTVPSYRLAAWSGDPACAEHTGASATLEAVDRDIVCTAEYVRGVGVSGAVIGAPIAVSASSGSSGASCSGASCAIDVGGTVTLNVPRPTGYTFAGWSGDAGCAGQSTSITLANVESSRTCVATFTRLRYTVRASRAPEAGGVVSSASGSSTAVCGASGCTVDHGASVTLVASDATGYDFSAWSGCSTSAERELTLANVTADQACQANFARRRLSVATAVVPARSGAVTTPCGASSCAVEYGGAIMLAAVESTPGYEFAGWSGCSSSTGAQLTLSAVTSDRSCVANFALRSYSVRAAVGRGQGSVSPCSGGGCAVTHGGSVTLTATPAQGYDFAGWSGDCAGSDASVELAGVDGDRTCTANFAARSYAVAVSVSPAGAGRLSAPCAGASCNVSVAHGASLALAVTAASTSYVFDHWSGCSSATTAATSIGPVTQAQSCVANFRRRYRVTTAVTPAGIATAPDCPSTAPCLVDEGGSQTLRRPTSTDARYAFRRWSGCTGSESRAGLALTNIRADVTCTAEFWDPRPNLLATIVVDGTVRFDGRTATVPVRVTVRNDGNAAATPSSKVSIDYIGPNGSALHAPFTLTGQAATNYQWIPDALAAGASSELVGSVTFPATGGTTVSLRALADSCAGEEFTQDYCRVIEISETDNQSPAASAVVPLRLQVTQGVIDVPIGTIGAALPANP